MENDKTCNESIKKIISNYRQLEKDIVCQLNFDCQHPTTIGTYRENVWKSLFERIVPKKFSIERSVFIIDSKGNISNEVDLAIFDNNYTPYIFTYGELKFIPIEAVAAVIECKSNEFKYSKLIEWAHSISKLETNCNSNVRTISGFTTNQPCKTQTATRPLKIFCAVKDANLEESKTIFDIIINPNNESLRINYSAKSLEEDSSLSYWHCQLNHCGNEKYCEQMDKKYYLNDYKVCKKDEKGNNSDEVTLLSFIFQFNQLLMIINNPLFFPHLAYVKMFNNQLKMEGK